MVPVDCDLKNLFGSDYHHVVNANNIKRNIKYAVSGKYDGKNVYLFKNNNKSSSDSIEGKIKSPDNNTVMALGANPNSNNDAGNFFNGTIYSVRIYNRALTDDEVMQNYKIDKMLYGVEDINE